MGLTRSQSDIIRDNLRAYLHHFEPIRIEKADCGDGFYVYQQNDETYVQYCQNIHYLNGWLYGAVQATCGQIRRNNNNEE